MFGKNYIKKIYSIKSVTKLFPLLSLSSSYDLNKVAFGLLVENADEPEWERSPYEFWSTLCGCYVLVWLRRAWGFRNKRRPVSLERGVTGFGSDVVLISRWVMIDPWLISRWSLSWIVEKDLNVNDIVLTSQSSPWRSWGRGFRRNRLFPLLLFNSGSKGNIGTCASWDFRKSFPRFSDSWLCVCKKSCCKFAITSLLGESRLCFPTIINVMM